MNYTSFLNVKPSKKWKKIKLTKDERITVQAYSCAIYISNQEDFEENKLILRDMQMIDMVASFLWVRKADNNAGLVKLVRWEHDENEHA